VVIGRSNLIAQGGSECLKSPCSAALAMQVLSITNMKRWLSSGCFLMCLGTCLCAAEPRESDAWKPFHFLIGDWIGSGSGKPGEGTGEFSLAFDLDKKILIRRNRNNLAPKTGEKAGVVHEDLMVIYPQSGGGPFRAEYFDSEGHVIHYGVSFAEHKAIFESDAAPGPKYKLTYELKPEGVLTIDFAVARPGAGFQTYVSGTAKRK
jgi:hypothetical protein